jgi:cutinase
MKNSALVAGLFAATTFAIPQGKGGKGGAPGGGGGAGCKKVAFFFARGSTEGGTMGGTVGPALQRALEGKFPGQVMTQGISYPASIDGAVSGAINPSGAPGALDMTKKVKAILERCPDIKIVLSGYSQGAEQVHGALAEKNLGPLGAKIAVRTTRAHINIWKSC